MRIKQILNPFFLYRHRERIMPYIGEQRQHIVRQWKLGPFRNRHRGKRCFIVGNGPSLTTVDLDVLKSEITFAANKIYMAFNETSWRPTYYVLEDDHMIRQHHEDIRRQRGFVKFVSNQWESLLRGDPTVIFYPRKLLHRTEFPQFSPNPVEAVYSGYMVTYVSLQLAFFMGIDRVYLVGVDFDYSLGKDGSNSIQYAANHSRDHFTPHYFKPGEILYRPQLDLARRAMECAKEFYEADGRKIWNATRGGKLDVFDRISVEQALED